MFGSYIDRILESVEGVRRQLVVSDGLRSFVGVQASVGNSHPVMTEPFLARLPDNVQWRIIDHCAAVTRLYAIFEEFSHDLIREKVSFCEREIPFSQLTSSMQYHYRLGLGKILEKLDGPRFSMVSLADLASDFHDAVSGATQYRLAPEAFLMHDQNLRIPELERLFAKCDIANVSKWLKDHPDLNDFFKDQDRLSGDTASQLLQLVQYRNDAAHGSGIPSFYYFKFGCLI